MYKDAKVEKLPWSVHTKSLFEEILEGNEKNAIFVLPLKIMDNLLREVAQRASQLHDEELDRLMIRLTLYSVADPYSPDYDEKIVQKYHTNRERSTDG